MSRVAAKKQEPEAPADAEAEDDKLDAAERPAKALRNARVKVLAKFKVCPRMTSSPLCSM